LNQLTFDKEERKVRSATLSSIPLVDIQPEWYNGTHHVNTMYHAQDGTCTMVCEN
jgi:hypothetical protein